MSCLMSIVWQGGVGTGYVLEAKSAEDDLVRRITNGIIIQKGDMKRV